MALIFLITLLSLTIFTSAKETMVGSGSVCDKLVENAGSVRLINFSYPNIEVEITTNSYIGSSFLGFFHPMKLMTENLATEIKIETQKFANPKTGEEIVEEVRVHGPDHLNLILDKYSVFSKYPKKEIQKFQILNQGYYELHFFARAKTFADLFKSRCTQGTLGIIELCTDKPDGNCDSEENPKNSENTDIMVTGFEPESEDY